MSNKQMFCLEVWGDYACFTNPIHKVERYSYHVITPTAARGIFTSIFWKPAFLWNVRKIEVFNPIEFSYSLRSEIKKLSDGSHPILVDYDNPKSSVTNMRGSLILQNVRYRIYAEMEFLPVDKCGDGYQVKDEHVDIAQKYQQIFLRRAKKGQHFRQPHLGMREFVCFYKLIESETSPPVPLDLSTDLGEMVGDIEYDEKGEVAGIYTFSAQLRKGVMTIPRNKKGGRLV